MKTDVIVVSSQGGQMQAALEQADKVAAYKGLAPKNALHLRLLTEEMLGVMRAITGETDGQFWIEDEDGVYQLHLRVLTRMDLKKREQLIAASTAGKNEAARGIMGRLRAFFEPTADYPVFAGPIQLGGAAQMYGALDWSMADYREQLRQYRQQRREGAEEAWDELEKSVVAHVADDVKVSVQGQAAEMIIYKRMD